MSLKSKQKHPSYLHNVTSMPHTPPLISKRIKTPRPEVHNISLSLVLYILYEMSGFLAPTRQKVIQFLAIDKEIFPMLAAVSLTTLTAGFVAGEKIQQYNSERNVSVAEGGYPWDDTASEHATSSDHIVYKYKFHKNGNPEGPLMTAPPAMVEYQVPVHLPKDQIPKQMLA